MKTKKTAKDEAALRKEFKLFLSDDFFSKFVKTVRRAGLVGEGNNVLVVYLACNSRLMKRPLNLFVKGSSGSGKNILVKSVLRFIPDTEIEEITTSSGASWSYQGTNLKNRILYIQEENSASGNVHPARLLISENKIVRQTTVRRDGRWITEKQVTEGPVACISTTTRNQLEVDDESRHLSIWLDESKEQSRQILRSMVDGSNGLNAEEIQGWHCIQGYFKDRAKIPVRIPRWLGTVADQTNVDNLRARRYFQTFLDGCKVVCMIRSFSRTVAENIQELNITFSDYAVASLILEDAFSDSLGQADDEDVETKQWVENLSKEKGQSVQASDLATAHSLAEHLAYARLRNAAKAGVICRANPSEKGNRKLYLPVPQHRFLPDPEDIFHQLAKPGQRLRFVHPVTGEEIVYER